MSEFEKMRAGEIYNPRDLKLIYMYDKTARRLHRYNKRCFHVYNMRSRLMKKIINTSGNFWIHPPFQCDYGCNIYLGKDVMTVSYTHLDVYKRQTLNIIDCINRIKILVFSCLISFFITRK